MTTISAGGVRPKDVGETVDEVEEDLGELLDFTRASPWEEFISALEEAVRADSPHARAEAAVREPSIGSFSLVIHRAARAGGARGQGIGATPYTEQMVSRGDGTVRLDGRFGTERIRRWFGLGDYAVLSPADGADLDSSEIALAQGALNVALAQSGRAIPGLVCHSAERGAFCGWACVGRVSTRFDVDCFDSLDEPERVRTREPSVMAALFRTKIGAHTAADEEDEGRAFSCDVWHTHVIAGWGRARSSSAAGAARGDGAADGDEDGGAEAAGGGGGGGGGPTAAAEWCDLLVDGRDASAWLGIADDPLAELHLACGWERLSASQLEWGGHELAAPLAPRWVLGVVPPDDTDEETPPSAAGALADAPFAPADTLPAPAHGARLANRMRALATVWQQAVGSAETLETLVARASLPSALGLNPRQALRVPAPHAVADLLDAIFAEAAAADAADAAARAADAGAPAPAGAAAGGGARGEGGYELVPPGSLTARLMRALASEASLVALAHTWRAFIGRARACWEARERLPALGAPGALPRAGTLLLHQKLQMLNCCVEQARRLERDADDAPPHEPHGASAGHSGRAGAAGATADADADGGGSGDGDGEEEEEEEEGEGRAAALPLLLALADGRQLYEPHTQPAVPMTEDQLLERIDALQGVGGEGAGGSDPQLLRARLQSSQLRSDMQAFKAANPRCELADFVRWHSPRDWVIDDGPAERGADADADADASAPAADAPPAALREWPAPPASASAEAAAALARDRRGALSSRFRDGGNLWQQLWSTTLPVPAARQRALFHAPREAEILLHWLETLAPTCALQQLLCGLVLSGAHALRALPCARAAACVRAAADEAALAAGRAEGLTSGGADAELAGDGGRAWARACDALARAELSAATAASLEAKLPPTLARNASVMDGLARGLAVDVHDDAERRVLARFACAGGADPSAAEPRPHAPRPPLELPEPDMQEYVLRSEACRPLDAGPLSGAECCAHRMYVGVRDEQCRVAIALSTLS